MPTSASGLTFYEEQFSTGVYLGLVQNTNAFNQASSGAISLSAGAAPGRSPARTIMQAVSGLIQTRDPSSSTDTLTPVRPGNSETKTVKVFDAAVMDWTMQDWEDANLTSETGTRVFGEQYGEAMAERHLNAALSAALGAILSIGSAAIEDVSGSGGMTYAVLNDGAGRMGDKRQMLRAVVGPSQPFNALLGQAFASQPVAFQLGSATIYEGSIPTLGLSPVVTDAPPLIVSGTPDNYYSLLLSTGAVSVKTGPTRTSFQQVVGAPGSAPANMTWRMQVESSFELEVMGCSYTGAALPNDAALATGANWTAIGATDTTKQGPGIAIRTQ